MQVTAIQQIGDKKDRTYRVWQAISNISDKKFIVKGIGKNFNIFDGDKQLATFKTLYQCKQYVGNLPALNEIAA